MTRTPDAFSVAFSFLTAALIGAMIAAPVGLWEKLPGLFPICVIAALVCIGLSGLLLSGKIK